MTAKREKVVNMGKGTNIDNNEITRTFSWNEIHEHSSKDDRWIVVDGLVYDITRFQKKHPGGAKIIGHFAGQDATVSHLSNIKSY